MSVGCNNSPQPVTYWVTIDGHNYDGFTTSLPYKNINITVNKDTVTIGADDHPLIRVTK